MNSKYIIGLILIVLASCSSPLTPEQKNSDAVYLKQVKEYTLNPDGTSSYHYYHKLLYNSYLSINRFYGETFVVYNPEFQILKVNKSETTMVDGKKFKSPENAFNEVLPQSAADAPDYNYLREMVITHVGLERGAIVELDYVIETKAGFTPFISDKVNLCESSPVKEVEVIVRGPKGEKLNYHLLNQPEGLSCKKTTKNDYDVYSWKSYNLNAFSHEPLQSEGLSAYPALLFSTVDLSIAFEYLKDNLTKNFVPEDAAKKLYNSEAKGWGKVEQIKNYVVSNINSYGVSPQLLGYRFRSPEAVWKSNGGTEGEKAILLSGLLKVAGFNAQVAVAGYPHFFSKEVGSLCSFDRYWVKVEFEGETRYLSAVEEHSNVPGQRIAKCLADDFTKTNIAKAPKPELTYALNADLAISADGKITGIAKVQMNSFDENKGVLSGIPSSAFTSTKTAGTNDAINYSITFTNPNLAEKVDGLFVFNLPNLAQGVVSLPIAELPLKRATTIELPGSINETYTFVFTLTKGQKIISPINETKVENSLGMCRIAQTTKDDKIIITRKLIINQAIITTENYTNFRQIVSLWADRNLNRVVVKAD